MFIQKCREYSLPLIAGVILAILWANLSPESYHHFLNVPIFGIEWLTFHFLVDDIFMVFFFAAAGVEIVNSLSPGGALNPIKKAVTPLMATAGGVLGPIIVFTLLNLVIGSPDWAGGWGIPTATDIALAWLIARIVFGKNHPAVSFLLLLAVADDAVGLVIIAVFYPDPLKPVKPVFLFFVALAMILAYAFRRTKIKSYWLYLLIPGVISWLGMYNAGLHPALSLVFIVPFMPGGAEYQLLEEDQETIESSSTLYKFEHRISPVVDFGLIMFGISNAGVEFSAMSNLTMIVLLSLLIGKTLGVSLFTLVATLLKFGLPEGMRARDVLVAGVIAGMGLTVALFVAGNAYTDVAAIGAAKMGALFSVVSAVIAIILGKILRVEKVKK